MVKKLIALIFFFGCISIYGQSDDEIPYFPLEKIVLEECADQENSNCLVNFIKEESEKVLKKFDFKTHFPSLTVNDTIRLYYHLEVQNENKLVVEDSRGSAYIYTKKFQTKEYETANEILDDSVSIVLSKIPAIKILNKKSLKYNPQHRVLLLCKVDPSNENRVEHIGDKIPYEGAVIQKIPMFPGCNEFFPQEKAKRCFNQKMQEHIRIHFKYPRKALRNGIDGKVYVNFSVNKEGDVENIRMRGPHPILEEEAKRIVQLLPKFEAGRSNGKPIKTPFSIPIYFQLQ